MGIAQYTYNRSTSGGEIIRELVNSTDGQGLHFDGAAGSVLFTPVDLGTKLSMEFIAQADSISGGDQCFVDFGGGGARLIFLIRGSTSKISIYSVAGYFDFGDLLLDDLKPHHLVATIDGTAAILYDNGNQVGTATITSPNVDVATGAAIGTNYNNTGSRFNGTIYRARLWNKTLSSTEVTDVYENATVPFADQYGSQTEVIDSRFTTGLSGWNAFNDWNSQTNPSNNMVLAASGAAQKCRTDTTLTAGKRYRCTYTASSVTDAPVFAFVNGGYAAITADVGSSTITAGTNSFEFVWPAASTNDLFYILSVSATAAVTLDDIFVWEIGCVSDYDLAFANPTQSLTVQDRAGAADGTASATGVTQVTPIEAVNTNKLNVGGTTPLVGIGLAAGTAPARALQVHNSGGAGSWIAVTDNTTGATGGDGLLLGQSGTNSYLWNYEAGDLYLGTSGGTKLTISSAGLATFSNGIQAQDGATNDGKVQLSSSASYYIRGGATIGYTRVEGPSVKLVANGTISAVVDGGGIYEVGGVLKENLLTNSGFDVWSNSTLENVGSNLVSSWSNISYTTFTSSGANITSAVSNGTGGQQGQSNTFTTETGKLYKLVVTITLNSGTLPVLYVYEGDGSGYISGFGSKTLAAGANTFVYEESSGGSSAKLVMYNHGGDATDYSCTYTHYEVTPGCVAADNLAWDGGYVKDTTLDCWRQHDDGGTNTKDGSFYSLKTTAGAADDYIYWPSYYNKAEHLQRFAGRTITFGCWVKTSTASHARIRLYQEPTGGTTHVDTHTGGGNWEWLEVPLDVNAAVTTLKVQFDQLVSGQTAYFSQPMLVFGSAIGEGNYSRPQGEIVWNEVDYDSVSYADSGTLTSNTTFNSEAESLGRIPKGAKALNVNLIGSPDAVGSYEAYLQIYDPTWATGLRTYGNVVGNRITCSGWVKLNSDGEYRVGKNQNFSELKLTFLGVQM